MRESLCVCFFKSVQIDSYIYLVCQKAFLARGFIYNTFDVELPFVFNVLCCSCRYCCYCSFNIAIVYIRDVVLMCVGCCSASLSCLSYIIKVRFSLVTYRYFR